MRAILAVDQLGDGDNAGEIFGHQLVAVDMDGKFLFEKPEQAHDAEGVDNPFFDEQIVIGNRPLSAVGGQFRGNEVADGFPRFSSYPPL